MSQLVNAAPANESPQQEDLSGPPAANRHRLPDERVGLTHHFSIAGHEGYLTVGLYPNGQPGEIFIRMAPTACQTCFVPRRKRRCKCLPGDVLAAPQRERSQL
jgi:hypothetical protein